MLAVQTSVCTRACVSVCVRVWGVKSLKVIFLFFRGFWFAAVKIHDTPETKSGNQIMCTRKFESFGFLLSTVRKKFFGCCFFFVGKRFFFLKI